VLNILIWDITAVQLGAVAAFSVGAVPRQLPVALGWLLRA
jgi:hypothetical protein